MSPSQIRNRSVRIMCLALFCTLLSCGSACRSEKNAQVTLFDGKSWNGWEGNLDWFRIEDGCIVGGTVNRPIPRNEFLCTRTQYRDFELRLKVKALGEGLNAGIQVRSRRIPDHHEMVGYQADVGEGVWGKLYDESRRNRFLTEPDPEQLEAAIRRDDWNDYVIRCEGRRVQLWLNGVQTVDYTETDESLKQTGIIGLQIHSGAPSEVWYKDIMIQMLPGPHHRSSFS